MLRSIQTPSPVYNVNAINYKQVSVDHTSKVAAGKPVVEKNVLQRDKDVLPGQIRKPHADPCHAVEWGFILE